MARPVRTAAPSHESSAASLLTESVIIVDLHFQASPQATLLVPQTALPRYDPRRRELWFLGLLVKKFRHPSPNQECLLKAFDEENWATAIFDPLPQKGETLPSKRLGDTLEALNSHHQSLGLLRFESRGGQLACWLPGPVAIASHAWPHAPKGARLAVVSP
jgi:hypothetical protein